MKARLKLVALAIGFSALLIACGGSSEKAAPASTEQVQRGGTLIATFESNPTKFDPVVTREATGLTVLNNVCEALVTINSKLEPVPWLAEKVDQPDPMTYVFQIRKGVKFHDGTEMNADAVKFSIDRTRTNPNAVSYADSRVISDVTVSDPYSLKVTLSEPSSPFLSRLSQRLGMVVSPAAVQAKGAAFADAPVCTGPFKFSEFRSDQFVRLERFDGYWRQGQDGQALPYLDKVEWRIIPEPATRLTSVQAGDVHQTSIRDQDMAIAKGDANLRVEQQPGFGFTGLALTINKPPFDNLALRQAVQFAIDRKEIIKAVYEGNREEAKGPIYPSLALAYDPNYNPYPYDLAKARAKLAEAGRAGGFEFTTQAADTANAKALMDLVTAQLARAGITMKVEQKPFGAVTMAYERGESNAYLVGYTAGLDPDQPLSSAFGQGGFFNKFPYNNPQVSELILTGRRATDTAARTRAYRQAVTLIMEDSPYVFFTYDTERAVLNKKVQNWYLGYKDSPGFSEYWLQK